MTPGEALDEVRKDLSQAFGDALSARILDAARTAAKAAEVDTASYKNVIDWLCKDERVLGMFGELGVRDKQSRWGKLV